MQTKYLKEICSLITKGTTPTSLGMKLNEGDVNFIKVECLSEDGNIIASKMQKIDQSTHNKLNRSQLHEGDILYSIAGSIGRMSVVNSTILPANTNQAVAILRPIKELVDTQYLFYFLKDTKSQKSAMRRIVQSVQTNLSLGELSNLEVAIPSLPIQLAVGKFMSNLDAKIAANNALAKTFEDIAQTLFQSWFIDFDPTKARMAGAKPAGMVDETAALFPDSMEESELGLTPKGWKVMLLGDLIKPKKGKTITKATCDDGEIPVVAGGLRPAYFHSTANVLQPAITVSASGANAGFVRLYFKDIWASDCSYISSEITKTVYFWYLFLSRNQELIYGMQQGAAQPHIYPSDLMRLKLSYPNSIDAVLKFEETVTPLFLEIGALERQSELLIKMRDSFLPRLISGELQIPEEMLAS
jgi:type I restriction enzyme, S subunit